MEYFGSLTPYDGDDDNACYQPGPSSGAQQWAAPSELPVAGFTPDDSPLSDGRTTGSTPNTACNFGVFDSIMGPIANYSPKEVTSCSMREVASSSSEEVANLPQEEQCTVRSSSAEAATPTTSKKVIHGCPASASLPKASKYIRPEICAVCEDKADGYHYEVPSCSGCKTFFRRTLLRQRRYACAKDGKCVEVQNNKLRFICQSCRYDKCVSAGMNPFAMTADIKAAKNPVVKNILSKRQMEIARIENNTDRNRTKVTVHLAPTIESNVDRLVDRLLFLELKGDKFRRSSYMPSTHFLRLEEVVAGHSRLGGEYEQNVKLYYFWEVDFSKASWPLPVTHGYDGALEGPAFKGEQESDWQPPMYAKHWKVMDAVVVIEYLKTLEFYHKLGERDKRALIRGVAHGCVLLQAAFHAYAEHESVMRFPDGSVLLYAEKYPKPIMERVPENHASIMTYGLVRMLADAQMDKQEYVLLKALMVCNNSLLDLSPHGQAILETERDRFARSLFCYVMAHRGPKKGPNAYVEMMTMVNTFMRTANTDKDVHVYLVASGSILHPLPLVDDIFLY